MADAYLMNHRRKEKETDYPYTFIYGVKIDTVNSNPETALTYTDDAVGFTPASGNGGIFNYGSWQDKYPFNKIKPCLFKNGVVVDYLNPNNYNQFENGATADITSGNAGDVMVEFPRIFWNLETVGTDLYVRYSDGKVNDNYKPLAHMRGENIREKVYISAYLGWKDNSNKLRSLSGKTPTASQNISTFRTQAQANGSGYDQIAYYQVLMLQVLYILMFKNRDSQTALGRGYVDGNSSAIATGGTNTNGMFYGETTGKRQLKFCGIEDWYGNLKYFLDGLYTNPYIVIGNSDFNDTGVGYYDTGVRVSSSITGFITVIQGTTEMGFITKTGGGSNSTYYADQGYLVSSRVSSYGGEYSAGSSAGAFFLRVYNSSLTTYADTGGRIFNL